MLKKGLHTAFILFLLGNCSALQAQFSFFTVNGTHISVHENCSTVQHLPSKGTSSISGTISIAVTPEGKLYGTEENTLFEINKGNGNVTPLHTLLNSNGKPIFGNSLVGLNNSTLLTLHKDTLYSIDINSGLSTVLGKTNFLSGGDLAFYEGKLYLSSNYNHLIEISLSSDNQSIASIVDIGEMDVNHAFSLCTIYENCSSKALYVITGNGALYKINPYTAATEFICDFDMVTYDAASFHDFVPSVSPIKTVRYPNVFSPNGDGMNDYYSISDSVKFSSFKIYDRWGKLVYDLESDIVRWDGKQLNGKEAQEGLYYYSAEFEEKTADLVFSSHGDTSSPCPVSTLILNQGVITLMR